MQVGGFLVELFRELFSKRMAALQLPIQKKFAIKSHRYWRLGSWLCKIALVTCSIVRIQCFIGVLLSTHLEVNPS